jgi:hypothetical protein
MNKSPIPIPWLLTPRYSRILSPSKVSSLPALSTSLLNKASWQSNIDKGKARSFMDALSSPRDAFIITTIARAVAASGVESIRGVSFSWKAASSSKPKAVVNFLTSASDVFDMIFLSNGLPGVHRNISSIDKEVLHPDIIEKFTNAKDTLISTPDSKDVLFKHKKLVVKRARIVDTWSVWDSTNTPIDDLSSSSRLKVREIGRSANVEISPSIPIGGGIFGFIQRTARTFFHFHGLQPLYRAAGQVTVAFVCSSLNNSQEGKETVSSQDNDMSSSDKDTSPTETKSKLIDQKNDVDSNDESIEYDSPLLSTSEIGKTSTDEIVHTLTFEAQVASTSASSSFSLLRYLWGDRVISVSGWRIVDIDGHFAEKEGHTTLSFSPLITRVRDITWRRAKLEMQECVDAVSDEAIFHGHVEALASRLLLVIQNLTLQVRLSDIGRNWWEKETSQRLGKRSISAAALPLQGILTHLRSAASELAEVQTNPPWSKRLSDETTEETLILRKNVVTINERIKKEVTDEKDKVKDTDPSVLSSSDIEILAKFLEKEGHIASLIAFTQLTPSAGWAVAAYSAIRHRVGKTMGELAGRRMDVEILYQVGIRGLIVLIEAIMDQLEIQLSKQEELKELIMTTTTTIDKDTINIKKDEEIKRDTNLSNTDSTVRRIQVDTSTDDVTLKSLLLARDAIETLSNLGILQDPSSMSMGVAVSSSQEIPPGKEEIEGEGEGEGEEKGTKKEALLSPQEKAKVAQIKLVEEIEQTSNKVIDLMKEMKKRGWLQVTTV